MKIFALSRTYGFLAGYENSFLQFLKAFRKLGHEVSVFHENETAVPKEVQFAAHRVPGLCMGGNGEKTEAALKEFSEILKREKPDRIFLNHVENPRLMDWLAPGKGCPVIRRVALHDNYCLSGTKFLSRSGRACSFALGWHCIANAYVNRCDSRRPDKLFRHFVSVRKNLEAVKRFHKIVVPSAYMEKVLIDNGAKRERIARIPPCSDFPKEEISDEGFLLFVGRISETKGLDCLLRSLQNVKHPMKLVVVGDGPAAQENQALAKRLGLGSRVEFKGHLPPEKVRDYERRCALMVHPSIWEDPASNVLVEAMVWAKPVVAFDVGGVSDFVREGVNGFLVPRKDLSALASRIELLANHAELRLKMGRAGREIAAKEFNEDVFQSRVAKMLGEI